MDINELEKMYSEMLDNKHGFVFVCGNKYKSSMAFELIDGNSYEEGMAVYLSSLVEDGKLTEREAGKVWND